MRGSIDTTTTATTTPITTTTSINAAVAAALASSHAVPPPFNLLQTSPRRCLTDAPSPTTYPAHSVLPTHQESLFTPDGKVCGRPAAWVKAAGNEGDCAADGAKPLCWNCKRIKALAGLM